MSRWSRLPSAVAVALPLLLSVAACALFIVWFGLGTAHTVETTAVADESRDLSMVASYIQHLVDDSVENAKDLDLELRGAPLPSPDQWDDLRLRLRSRGHVRFIGLLDEHGRLLSFTGSMPDGADALWPMFAARIAGHEPLAFRPHPSAVGPMSLPGFLLAVPLRGGPAASVVFDIASQTSEHLTLKVADLDAAFALIDGASGVSTVFGGHVTNEPWTADAMTRIDALPADTTAHELCRGGLLAGGRCMVYRHLHGAPLVLAGLIDGDALRAEWIRVSRPMWIFAVLVLAASAVGAACNGMWLRQRRLDRAKLAVALADVERAYAAKSNFLAHMSHELRTPLNSIIGFSELIRQAFFGPLNERYRSYAEDIHASARHLHKLASDMMDVERLERGGLASMGGTADLNEVAADAVRMLAVLADEQGVNIDLVTLDGSALVEIEPHRAAQIAVNLVSNAVKYSERGDRVDVVVERRDDGAMALVVADEGIGMTPEEIAYTAEPFGLPAERRSGRHDSVGLGLPIVRGLLAAVGGHLVIASEKHHGTTVSAIFPHSAAEQDNACPALAHPVPRTAEAR